MARTTASILCTLALLAATANSRQPIHFVDVSRSAGLQFVHDNGSVGEFWLAEIMGAGVAGMHSLDMNIRFYNFEISKSSVSV